jgi:flagellar protein FliS
MATTIQDAYLAAEILSADPVKLVIILYRAAIEAVGAARRNLRAGLIRERSQKISKASAIICELVMSLDHARGGEISRSLARLYDYMRMRLNEANAQQIDPPLAEVERLLSTLLGGWVAAVPTEAVSGTAHEPISCTC